MRTAILAAGRGTRLGGGTPKILRKVGGRTILSRHMDSLKSLGTCPEEVIVVTGWFGEQVREEVHLLGAAVVHNPHWDCWGTARSFQVIPEQNGELLVLHGDLVWEPDLLRPVLDLPGDLIVPVDTARRDDSEAMKAEQRHGRLIHLSKDLPLQRSFGESMGVFLIRSHRELKRITCGIPSGEAALDDVVNIAAGRMDIRVIPVTGFMWEEIDTPDDLMAAERMFSE